MAVDVLTEYFNGFKWKSVKDYEKGEKVLQYNSDGTATLVIPYDYCAVPLEKALFFGYLDPSLPICLTGEHLVVIKENGCLQLVPYNNLRCVAGTKLWHMPVACEYRDSEDTRDISYTNELDYTIQAYREGKVDDGHFLKWFGSGGQDNCSLGFSDKVYHLSERSRRKLIGSIVQSERIHNNREALQSFINICNITPGYMGLYYIRHNPDCYTLKSTYNELTVPYRVINGTISEYISSGSSSKYFFGVPSQMMVFRRKGAIFVAGCK